MPAEAPYLFSLAGLNLTLAGFGGLVWTIRRSGGWSALDLFRLREIVEFGFANSLLALLPIPLLTSLGDATTALRLLGAIAALYAAGSSVALVARMRRSRIQRNAEWVGGVTVLLVAILAAALATVAQATFGPYEWTLLLLLCRPMLAFLFVLSSIASGGP